MREDIESSRRDRRKQRHSRGGLQYCRSMFQGRSLTKSGGATSFRGRSVQKKPKRVRLVCSWKIKVALPKRWSLHYSLEKSSNSWRKIQAISNKHFVPRREEYEVLFCWARRENIGINCTCASWHLIGWANRMQEVIPERKWAGSITGKGGFMVITLTLIYPVV